MNDALNSCGNVRVRVNRTEGYKQIQHVFPTTSSNTQSNAQMIFYGSKPKQNSSWVMA